MPHRQSLESLESRRLLTIMYEAHPSSYDFDDLVAGAPGVVTLLDNSDDGWQSINLATLGGGPNTFKFFGQTFTELFVSANGLITLVNGSTDPNNSDLTTTPPQRTIAVLWDDWDTSGGTDSAVLYRYNADREELTIEWNNVTHVNVGGNNGVTFQAILDLNEDGAGENDEILMQYADLDVGHPTYDNGRSATVGIKDLGTQGVNRLLVSQNGSNPMVGAGRAIKFEEPLPLRVIGSKFNYEQSPHTLTLVFPRNVIGADPEDLSVQPLGGGTAIVPSSVSGNGTSVLRFSFQDSPQLSNGRFGDGRYVATLAAGSISENDGSATLPSDQQVNFLFLLGDANNNGTVNLQDFNILAANFGQSDRNYSHGDFNYDGTVNLQDFNILASRFGQSVGPEPTMAATTITGSAVQRGNAFAGQSIRSQRPGLDALEENDPAQDLPV